MCDPHSAYRLHPPEKAPTAATVATAAATAGLYISRVVRAIRIIPWHDV